jgi:hypothetical protein
MNPIAQRRFAAISGIAFVVLSAAFPVLAGIFPPLDAEPAELVRYYASHQRGFLWGNYLAALAGGPSLVLLAHFAWRVRRKEGDAGWWWMVVLGSGLVVHAVGLGVLLTFQTVAVVAVSGAEMQAKTLSDLANMGFGFFLIVQAGCQIGSGLAVLSSRALSRALGWASVFGSVVTLGASLGSIWTRGPLAAGGLCTLAAFSLFIGWNLWLSIEIWRER